MIRVDVSAVSAFAERIVRLSAAGVVDGLASEAARKLSEEAQMRTPVDTGRLRAGWEIVETGARSAVVQNRVHYSLFVERGHRTRNGGFVQGRWMLADAVEAAWEQLPQMVEARIRDVLKGGIR